MSTQKRALAPTSSGQPSQPKRPCCAPIDQEWSGSEMNHVLNGCLSVEDVQRVVRQELVQGRQELLVQVRQELEYAMSHWAKHLQSCIGNALKDIIQQMPSKENDFQKQTKPVELGNSLSTHLGRNNAQSTGNDGARNLQLHLQTKLSHPLFTGKKIEGEEGARIYVALIDANTADVVTSGPESSIKLDAVVLEGDFNKDNGENWAPEEFENYVVKERKGKRPLLTGNLQVTLKGGVGELGDLTFTDNSSWNKSKIFKIGLKVASSYGGNTRIREAITHAFSVKEHRGEAYRKHHPPASDDEVWRLEKIAKDGISHQKLSEAGIYKVDDFLLQLFTDPKKLKEILGKSITEKKWDSLVLHAKTCKTKWKLYLDYHDGMMKHGAVFDSNNKTISLVKDRVYIATHRLSAQEKDSGNSMEFSLEDNFHPAAHHPMSSDRLNVLISPGDNGFATVEFPRQPQGVNLQSSSQTIDCLSQMDYTINEHVCPCEPPHTSVSQFSSRFLPGWNHMMVDYQPMVSDDLDCWFSDACIQTPLCDDGCVRGTSKGVNGWLKIKAVLQWGFFYRRGVRLVPLDEPPNEVQA